MRSFLGGASAVLAAVCLFLALNTLGLLNRILSPGFIDEVGEQALEDSEVRREVTIELADRWAESHPPEVALLTAAGVTADELAVEVIEIARTKPGFDELYEAVTDDVKATVFDGQKTIAVDVKPIVDLAAPDLTPTKQSAIALLPARSLLVDQDAPEELVDLVRFRSRLRIAGFVALGLAVGLLSVSSFATRSPATSVMTMLWVTGILAAAEWVGLRSQFTALASEVADRDSAFVDLILEVGRDRTLNFVALLALGSGLLIAAGLVTRVLLNRDPKRA